MAQMKAGLLLAAAILPLNAVAQPEAAQPVAVPFDFSRSAIGLDVTINGTPLYVLLDTGVDPSVIDLGRADALGLKVDRGNGGDASGFGSGKGPAIYPSAIAGLAIAGQTYPAFDALASDMGGLSDHYGRKLDGIIGYSFLSKHVVLIDYPQNRVGIMDAATDAAPLVKGCRTRWRTPMRLVDNFPVIGAFRLGKMTAPVSYDTGSNSGIAFYRNALDMPGIKAALTANGEITHAGARGDAKSQSYALNEPVGFGPFSLPAGETVFVLDETQPRTARIANIGNRVFATMKVKMLLDYPARRITVYGDCG